MAMSTHEQGVNVPEARMSADRFAALVDAYGSDPVRWPAGERAAAEAFAADPAGRAIVAESAGLDRALDRLSTEHPSAALVARILSGFDSFAARRAEGPLGAVRRLAERTRDAIWPGAPLWKPASAFAASLAIGLAMGVLVPTSVSARDSDPSANILVTSSAVFDLDHGN